MNEKNNSMPDILKYLRKNKNMTQKELADAIGVSYSAIISYENGYREPNSKAMAKLENFYGVTGDFLRGNIHKTPRADKINKSFNSLVNEYKNRMNEADDKTKEVMVLLFQQVVRVIIKKNLIEKLNDFNMQDFHNLNKLIETYIALKYDSKDKVLERIYELTIIEKAENNRH